MADTEKMYELRKALRRLGAFRGSGTELISVYIPAGSPIHEMTGKLREEMSQASNIKSKSTRTNVIGALERILHHLKIYKITPQNGIAVFCGNISDNPSKTDIELFSIEPPQPLQVGAYRCDSRFFLEPLGKMGETEDTYGIVVLDGREATLALMRGTHIRVVERLNSMAHAKIRKGGQCLAAGTLVMSDTGEIIEIENFSAKLSGIGIDFQQSMTTPVSVSDFFITPAKHSLLITTKAPMYEIRTTPYHRFFVLSEYGIKEKFAKDLNYEDRILITRRIRCNSGPVKVDFEPSTRFFLDAEERKRLKEARIKVRLSQLKAASKIEVSQMVISHLETGKQTPTDEHLRSIYRLYGLQLDEEALSKKTLKLPEYWNEDLARLCGVICGDGSEDGNRIIIYEGRKDLAQEYCALVERAIGITPTMRVVNKVGQKGSFAKKEYYEVRIYSLEFRNAIMKIAPEIVAVERDIPKAIIRCPASVVAAFLRGIYDAEGYIHGSRVDIAMTSKKIMQKIQLLLLRFGIISSFAEKRVVGNRQWAVGISDRNSLSAFLKHIGFTQKGKSDKLLEVCKKAVRQQYCDQIPIDGREVFRLATEIGLKTTDFHAASCFFRNKKPLGRAAFARNILSVFKNLAKKNRRSAGIADYLEKIYLSDITMAKLKEKHEIENEENFYDMTVPVHSNFIANGFVVHNSARRYERLIEESIEKYYVRVGHSIDKYFLGNVKGVIIGGPGPTKDFFVKANAFNYQIKVLGVVDTGYTDEYGIREVLAKSEGILAEQEAVKERALVERFIKEVVNEGLATYGGKEVQSAILSRQAETVLISEALDYTIAIYSCNTCTETERHIIKIKPEGKIRCKKCNGEAVLEKEEPLLEYLIDIAKENNIKVEVISTNTAEGAQFLQGFGGAGVFLRYKSRG